MGSFYVKWNWRSKHELKTVFIGPCTSKVSENSGCYASVLDFDFSETQNKGFCFSEASCDTHDKKCDTYDAAFF